MNNLTHDDCAVEHCKIEHQVLKHVKDALRVTLAWNVPSVGIPRKLSSVQFTFRSFRRHFERLMELEERGGYMADVSDTKPNMSVRAEVLLSDHDQFRAEIRDLEPALDRLTPTDEDQFRKACEEVMLLLKRTERHDAKEADLLYDAFMMDEGGEG